jgi:hypothetical protein
MKQRVAEQLPTIFDDFQRGCKSLVRRTKKRNDLVALPGVASHDSDHGPLGPDLARTTDERTRLEYVAADERDLDRKCRRGKTRLDGS